MFFKGQIVFSKCGRDKGSAFIVVVVEDEYIYLVDGRLRPLSRPKKKKIKHVQPTKTIIKDIQAKLNDGGYLQDADFRKALASYDVLSVKR